MKALLLVLGGGAIVYGALLYHRKYSTGTTGGSVQTVESPAAGGGAIITGPSIANTSGSAQNTISPVERYAADPSILFPPVSIIQVPGAGCLDGIGLENMHPIVQF